MKYGLLGSIAVRIRAISVLQMPPVGLSCMRALTRGSALNVLLRTFGRVNMPVSTRGCKSQSPEDAGNVKSGRRYHGQPGSGGRSCPPIDVPVMRKPQPAKTRSVIGA
jgi:hypothetical protein